MQNRMRKAIEKLIRTRSVSIPNKYNPGRSINYLNTEDENLKKLLDDIMLIINTYTTEKVNNVTHTDQIRDTS